MERGSILLIFKRNEVRAHGLPYLEDRSVVVFYNYWISIGKPKKVELSWNAGNPIVIKAR